MKGREQILRAATMVGLLALALPTFCQQEATRSATFTPPTVTFTLDFPGSEPDHYSITIASDGHAAYESTSKLSADSDDEESYHFDFTVSPANRARIFDLAAKAGYFAGKIDSGKRHIASTGSKTLIYNDGQRRTSGAYNFSPLPAVQQLTALFQSMSSTLECGHRISYDLRYQRLALDEELKHMEEMAKANELEEIQAIVPILREVVADQGVINVVRARAQRLIDAAGVSSASAH